MSESVRVKIGKWDIKERTEMFQSTQRYKRISGDAVFFCKEKSEWSKIHSDLVRVFLQDLTNKINGFSAEGTLAKGW